MAISTTIEEVYQKKSQLEHVLLRPDTYIGSIEPDEKKDMWVVERDENGVLTNRMCRRNLTIVPGLYKIFDEILVNAADNKQRDFKNMNKIQVDIDREKGLISVWNNGKGIPVVMHSEHNVYVPSLIFGELLTSSNYNDSQKKVTGGRNGFGAKLTNIFSRRFVIETSDSNSGLVFRQVFTDNMSVKHEPEISKAKPGASDYTKVTFEPDFEKFGMPDGLDDDIVDLMVKRTYDMAGCTDASLRVVLNGTMLKVRSFKEYVNMYLPEESTTSCVYAEVNERWRVCIAPSQGNFEQVSFVNSIWTIKGGAHVVSVVDQVSKYMIEQLMKGSKNKGMKLKPMHVKNQMFVFVSALIENPAFDSQTKETLTTRPAKFGSKCVLEANVLQKIMKIGISEQVMSWAKFKESKELKKNDGHKRSKIVGIPKLDDANKAGGKEARKCTLILTEGDSAKALALSGLSVVGRDYFGVFPLKGKLLNVRVASHAQIMKNEEIANVKKILGLQHGKKYTDISSLRYGKLMIMADQDTDGSHIKGLVINVLHHYWPELLQLRDFVTQFITPIVRCTKASRVQTFFTIPEYQRWRQQPGNMTGWKAKYYKGLGTSTSKEAKEYFKNIDKHRVDFTWDQTAGEDDAIDMAFSKKRIEDRKTWLQQYEPGTFMDYSRGKVSFSDFVNHELILFSREDNMRSIPSMVDGLKPGQRKVLFSCFKRNLKGEIKVAQLAGYVSEHSAYHHGEQSLCSTIVNMAHDYVGSLNINLLLPLGQFGTRHLLGKDAASPRYIFTTLSPVTRALFPPSDDALLTYLEDDGLSIEPDHYIPIIPLVLVNGAEGIGTGYSTSVPNFDPKALVTWLQMRIVGRADEVEELQPWYKGFQGEIVQQSDAKGYAKPGKYDILGKLHMDEEDDSIVHITELPVRKSTELFKELLATLMSAGTIRDFDSLHTDTRVHFVVYLPEDHRHTEESLMKTFKLSSSLATTNMTLFDPNGKLKCYQSAEEILEDFYRIRLDLYVRRKAYLLRLLKREVNRISNKVRFIGHVIDETIVIRNVPKAQLVDRLEELGYDTLPSKDTANEELENGNYDYLLSMPMLNLTKEKVEEMRQEKERKMQEQADLQSTSPEQLWLKELDELVSAMDKQNNIEDEERVNTDRLQKEGSGQPKPKRVTKQKPKLKPKLNVQLKKGESEVDAFEDRIECGQESSPMNIASGEDVWNPSPVKPKAARQKAKAAPTKSKGKAPSKKAPILANDDDALDFIYGEKKRSGSVPVQLSDDDFSDDDDLLIEQSRSKSLVERLREKKAASATSTTSSKAKSTARKPEAKPKKKSIVLSSEDEGEQSEATFEVQMRELALAKKTKSTSTGKERGTSKPKPAPKLKSGIKRSQKKKVDLDENLAPMSTPAKGVSPMLKKRKPLRSGTDEEIESVGQSFDGETSSSKPANSVKKLAPVPLSPHTPVVNKTRARRVTKAVSYKDHVVGDDDDDDDDFSDSVSAFSDDDDDSDY